MSHATIRNVSQCVVCQNQTLQPSYAHNHNDARRGKSALAPWSPQGVFDHCYEFFFCSPPLSDSRLVYQHIHYLYSHKDSPACSAYTSNGMVGTHSINRRMMIWARTLNSPAAWYTATTLTVLLPRQREIACDVWVCINNSNSATWISALQSRCVLSKDRSYSSHGLSCSVDLKSCFVSGAQSHKRALMYLDYKTHLSCLLFSAPT